MKNPQVLEAKHSLVAAAEKRPALADLIYWKVWRSGQVFAGRRLLDQRGFPCANRLDELVNALAGVAIIDPVVSPNQLEGFTP